MALSCASGGSGWILKFPLRWSGEAVAQPAQGDGGGTVPGSSRAVEMWH